MICQRFFTFCLKLDLFWIENYNLCCFVLGVFLKQILLNNCLILYHFLLFYSNNLFKVKHLIFGKYIFKFYYADYILFPSF